jgi:hypothetical protein
VTEPSLWPDRDAWLAAFQIVRRRAPVPVASSGRPNAPLKSAQDRVEPHCEFPRPCSRCGAAPRNSTSGWCRDCIASKMRSTRAARRLLTSCHSGTAEEPRQRRAAAIEHARERAAAFRAEGGVG